MTDSSLQRLNMVESQVRPSDVTDRRVIKAMLEVPREAFVPAALASMAYMDEPVPVCERSDGSGPARSLLAPRTFAKLVQLAGIGPEAVVLDVGCATGYSTAVLARLAKRVVAVECDAALAAEAARTLQRLGVDNALVKEGSLPAGAPAEGTFDAILLNGAVPAVPQPLLDQLKDGGRLVAIVAEGPPQGPHLCRARVWQRTGRTFDTRPAFEAGAASLPGFAAPAGFVF
jgi:protein-L-isoaspartate(D-aspartate) O-methyltransferase